MKYVATVQDNIIVAKGINYTDYVAENEIELTEEEFNTIPIPCRKVDGEFIPCDFPEVEIVEEETDHVYPTQIELVSYTGTDTAGEANPCSVTFSFAPKIAVMICGYCSTPSVSGNSSYMRAINCDYLTTEYKERMSFYDDSQQYSPKHYAKKSEDGKTIYWYVADDTGVSRQYNSSTTVYTLLAIG